jgi:hypothetical protein
MGLRNILGFTGGSKKTEDPSKPDIDLVRQILEAPGIEKDYVKIEFTYYRNGTRSGIAVRAKNEDDVDNCLSKLSRQVYKEEAPLFDEVNKSKTHMTYTAYQGDKDYVSLKELAAKGLTHLQQKAKVPHICRCPSS